MSLLEAVNSSLVACNLTQADTAAANLARKYATAIDDGTSDIEDVGPKLLTALNALGATPAGRSRMKTGGNVGTAPDELAKFRARHSRTNGA